MNDILQSVIDYVEAQQDRVLQLLQQMVRIPSVTCPPSGGEGPCQAFMADFFRAMNLETDVFEPTQVEGLTEHPGYWPGLDYAGDRMWWAFGRARAAEKTLS
jgi:acetylornithine deacetylase